MKIFVSIIGLLLFFSVSALASLRFMVPSKGAPAFVPPGGLTNVTLWYDIQDATKITQSGGFISAITDKSPNGINASESSSKPEYDATGINGYPAAHLSNVAFSGGQGMTMTATPARVPSTVFIVMRKTGTSTGTIFGKTGQPYGFLFPTTDYLYSYGASDGELQYIPGVASDTGAVVEYDFSASVGASAFYINNVQKTPLSTDTPWSAGTKSGFSELFRSDGVRDYHGWVGEIIVSDTANSTQRSATYNYLKAKWGTP